jgi:hypothetical protein
MFKRMIITALCVKALFLTGCTKSTLNSDQPCQHAGNQPRSHLAENKHSKVATDLTTLDFVGKQYASENTNKSLKPRALEISELKEKSKEFNKQVDNETIYEINRKIALKENQRTKPSKMGYDNTKINPVIKSRELTDKLLTRETP